LRGRGGGVGQGDVEVAFDELEVGGEVAEEGVDGGRGQVAEAEDLADFAGGEEFLELFIGRACQRRSQIVVSNAREDGAYLGRDVLGPKSLRQPGGFFWWACGGGVWMLTMARSGMKRSPKTRTSLDDAMRGDEEGGRVRNLPVSR